MARRTPQLPPAGEAAGRLLPPADGAIVRMYRTGHGDCFLLAFPGTAPDEPVYVLIDCGYKPGSPKFIDTNIKEIIASLRESTGGRIDVAVITHEHQDHVNGITSANFAGFTIGETWLPWTENPNDDLANELRRKYHDSLLGLLAARDHIAAAGETGLSEYIDGFLAFELGGDEEEFNPAAARALLGAADGAGTSMNKRSMKVFKDLAEGRVQYIRPHESIRAIPRAGNLRVFALGPPRDTALLGTLDPTGGEEFHMKAAGMSLGRYLAVAIAGEEAGIGAPFAGRYQLRWAEALDAQDDAEFFARFYGRDDIEPSIAPLPGCAVGEKEVAGNPPWRRIDKDWLRSMAELALDMNNGTNNASLVLAFELGKGGKVLLFAADAQRGNWLSWGLKNWNDGGQTVTARDLLARTVFYKVGHHGSHNATLNGRAADDYPNLAWMAEGDHAREFTAAITAVRAWACTQNGWDHPLKAIKDALLKKASGRVLQTDTDVDKMPAPDGSTAEWDAFRKRLAGHRLYFDYTVSV